MQLLIDLQGAQASNRRRGIGNYSRDLAFNLTRLAHGKHRVSLLLNGAFADTIDPIRQAFDGLVAGMDFHIWYPLVPCNAQDPANAWRRNASEALYTAFIRSLNVDFLLVTSLFEGLVDDAISALPGDVAWPPTAVVLYDLIPYINPLHYLENPAVSSWYHGRLDRARKADVLLGISSSSSLEAIDYLGSDPDQVVNISSAINARFCVIPITEDDADKLRSRYGLKQHFVMYTGGNDHRKNIEGLIGAYASLPKALRARHQLAVVCAVDDTARQRLMDLAAGLGVIDDELVLTGFVPEDDLIALYNLCALFVFPSLYEGFGLPVLEAMACGAPTLASNCSSLPEVVGWEEALFDPLDVRDIAKAIRRGLTDTMFRQALKMHGLSQAPKFSWEATAQRALNALERLHTTRKVDIRLNAPFNGAKPRLAFIAPLQPARSGIADYSAELLPALAAHYDIEAIVAQDESVTDPWVLGNAPQRTVAWFENHAHEYDRILYHFGNSNFHQHMFELLERYPGVVVLHDFFLSGIQAYRDVAEATTGAWVRELLHSHGWAALQHRFEAKDTADVVYQWPCNLSVLQRALGVIVHAEYSRQLAEHWYGAGYADDWKIIPLLRTSVARPQRKSARTALNLRDDDVLVCAFGLLGKTKLNHRLIKAWLDSRLAQDPSARLVFVGEANGAYGAQLQQQLHAGQESIYITGWAEDMTYRQYLAAADLAVQLRTLSRGETSAAVLDCMNYGIATIVNANGSMAELPRDAVWMLDDDFSDESLTNVLLTLRDDTARRLQLGVNAREHICDLHQPRACAARYFQAIEEFYGRAERGLPALERQLSRFGSVGAADLSQFALRAAELFPPRRPVYRQLMVDISELHQRDAKSGIQRVVRSVLRVLLKKPPVGFRIEPVYASPTHGYRYARRFTARFLGLGETPLDDAPIFTQAGDIFWGLDLQPSIVPQHQAQLATLRLHGVKVVFTVYDLLPVMLPEAFFPGANEGYSHWLNTLAVVANGLISISASVSNQLQQWLQLFGPQKGHAVRLGFAHLGSDMIETGKVHTIWHPTTAQVRLLSVISQHPAFLMVGTLEPRKAQTQALVAFESLWDRGEQVNLVIVGKQGWLVEELVMRLRNHPLRERHLFWLEGIEDPLLEQIYVASDCLLAVSLDEGYGLPLIEAARHGLPILARDIPVFREVAGDHASYFTGTSPSSLTDAVARWLKIYRASKVVPSSGMTWMNWTQATEAMLDIVLHDKWHSVWQPKRDEALVVRYWGSDPRLGSAVGKRVGTELWSSGNAGHLLYGPYLDLKPGHYIAKLHGRIGVLGLHGAKAIVCVSGGQDVLVETSLFGIANHEKQFIAHLDFILNKPCKGLEVRVDVEQCSDLAVSLLEILKSEHAASLTSEKDKHVGTTSIHATHLTKPSSPVLAFWATHAALCTAVGYPDGRTIFTTGKAGYLLYGPYTSLAVGCYAIRLEGNVTVMGEAWLDITCDNGLTEIFKQYMTLQRVGQVQRIADIQFTLDHFVTDLEIRIYVTAESDMQIEALVVEERSRERHKQD